MTVILTFTVGLILGFSLYPLLGDIRRWWTRRQAEKGIRSTWTDWGPQ